MKDKIFVFIIGTLVGARIATGAFLLYSNTLKNKVYHTSNKYNHRIYFI